MLDATAVITYKNTFVVNSQPITFSFDHIEVVTCKNIFLCPLLKKIKSSIITDNTALVNVLLVEQFHI